MQTQTDNLAEMIRDPESDTSIEKPKEELIPDQTNENVNQDTPPTEQAAPQVETTPADPEVGIRISNLSSWFEENRTNITNVRRVRMDIAGIDPDKTLLLSVVVPNQTPSEGQEPNRDIFIFKNADTIPVLDIPGSNMFVYNNGFEIHYQLEDDYILKCYGVKTGLIIVHCLISDNHKIPFAKDKVKRKDLGINSRDHVPFKERLETIKDTAADTESIQIQYKQVAKHLSTITTNQEAIDWLLNRQVGLQDINHLLQLDDVIISILS